MSPHLSTFVFIVVLYAISPSMSQDYDHELLCSEITCDDYECPEIENCEYGFVPDVCECCIVCAKGPGEQCGGMYNLAGICTSGYYCEPHPKYPLMAGICTKNPL